MTLNTAGSATGPGTAALTPAAEQRLGDLLHTFPAKKLGTWRVIGLWLFVLLFFAAVVTIPFGIWFLVMVLRTPNCSKKAAAKKALVFEHGLVLAGIDGPSAVYRFDSMAVTQMIKESGSYGISRIQYVFWITDHTGRSEKLTDLYARIDELGGAIQHGVTRSQVPGVMAELGAGREVTFGELRLGREALGIRQNTVPWSDVKGIRIREGYLAVDRTGRRLAATTPVRKIPNVFVFMSAAEHLLDAAH